MWVKSRAGTLNSPRGRGSRFQELSWRLPADRVLFGVADKPEPVCFTDSRDNP